MPHIATQCAGRVKEQEEMAKRKESITLRMDADVVSWLKRAARNGRVTVSHLIRAKLNSDFEARRK